MLPDRTLGLGHWNGFRAIWVASTEDLALECLPSHRVPSGACHQEVSNRMPFSAILIGIVILFIIVTVPAWPYSRTWGLWPSGALGLLLVVLIGLLVMG